MLCFHNFPILHHEGHCTQVQECLHGNRTLAFAHLCGLALLEGLHDFECVRKRLELREHGDQALQVLLDHDFDTVHIGAG